MNKTKTHKALSFFEKHALVILLALWLLFGCLAVMGLLFSLSKYTDANETDSKSILDYLNVSYVAAGALFTGFAFVITYLSLKQQSTELKNQNERLEKQISIDVFSDAFGHVLDVDRFREAKKFIYSNQFREAVDELVSSRSQNIKQLIHAENAELEEKKRHINQSNDDEESKKTRTAGVIINHNDALRRIRTENGGNDVFWTTLQVYMGPLTEGRGQRNFKIQPRQITGPSAERTCPAWPWGRRGVLSQVFP